MLLNSFKTPPYLITASVTPPSYTQKFRGEPSPFITIFALIVNQHPAVELPAANNYRHCTLIASEVSAIAKKINAESIRSNFAFCRNLSAKIEAARTVGNTAIYLAHPGVTSGVKFAFGRLYCLFADRSYKMTRARVCVCVNPQLRLCD